KRNGFDGLVSDDPYLAFAARHLEGGRIAVPMTGKPWCQLDPLAVFLDSENAFDRRPVQPTSGAGIPGPAAATALAFLGIDVGNDHIGLDPIMLGGVRVQGMVDGIEHREAPVRVVETPHFGQSDDKPGRRMGVLAAILAYAGRIALDVTRILLRLREGRGEQLYDFQVVVDQQLDGLLHCRARARRIAVSRQDAPGLRDGIDPALFGTVRAERRAVVETAATIPLAVPRSAFKRPLERP